MFGIINIHFNMRQRLDKGMAQESIRWDKEPLTCFSATEKARSDLERIKSITASAWERSIRPPKKHAW